MFIIFGYVLLVAIKVLRMFCLRSLNSLSESGLLCLEADAELLFEIFDASNCHILSFGKHRRSPLRGQKRRRWLSRGKSSRVENQISKCKM